jgi:monoamine oxidase
VAVVGGGMAGIYAAYRLRGCDGSAPPHGAGRHPQVALFERSRHVAGRVRSVEMTDTRRYGELGAMRWVPSQHDLVQALVNKFSLPYRDWPVDEDNNLSFLREKRMTIKEVRDNPGILPYHLREDERGKRPDQLLTDALTRIVPNFANMTKDDWKTVQAGASVAMRDPATGQSIQVPINTMGFRNLLARFMSPEAARLVTDAFGYDSIFDNISTVQSLKAFDEDFNPNSTYRTLQNGMQDLPNTLQQHFEGHDGRIFLLHRLEKVDYDRDLKAVVLTFLVADGERKYVKYVLADKAVLAMPQRPLRTLMENSPVLNAEPFRSRLEMVTPNPMTRILTGFDKRWWEPLGITQGRNTSDTATRQVYIFNGEADQANGFTMTYCDGKDSAYWAGYHRPDEPDSPKRLRAEAPMVADLLQHLQHMHGVNVPTPTKIVYKQWASEAYGGAYHSWNAGTRPWEVAPAMLQPLRDTPGSEDIPIYLCGEAYSQHQGWIQGALETSEAMLRLLGKSGLNTEEAAWTRRQMPPLDCMSCHGG